MSFLNRNKAEEWLFYFFLFAAPFQVRVILMESDWLFNEWRSASFYATDLAFLVLLGFWLSRLWQIPKDEHFAFDAVDRALVIFLGAAALSMKNTYVPAVSGFHLVKLFECAALFFYVKYYVPGRFELRASLLVLVAGGLFQSAVALGQFLVQHDLGLQKIGESVLQPQMQGVAVFFNAAGEKIMRAYGTVPHPNILAGYLLLSLFALYHLFLDAKHAIARHWALSSYAVLLFAFLLTFSRTTIFVWVLATGAWGVFLWLRRVERKRLLEIAAATVLICAIFAVLFWPEIVARLTISAQEEAVSLRLYYNKTALRSGFAGPAEFLKFLEPVLGPVLNLNWTGIGIGAFVSWFMFFFPGLSRHLYQPAHNIYLLIYSELGIVGIATFLFFLGMLLRQYWKKGGFARPGGAGLAAILLALLFVGLFDHFPWTLQQGRLMFWGVLGAAAGLAKIKSRDII